MFFAGARSANPLTIIPGDRPHHHSGGRRGGAGPGLQLAVALAVGIGHRDVLVSGVSHALFPGPSRRRRQGAAPAAVSAEAASWSALRATLVVMPVFVLALTNPALYLAGHHEDGDAGPAGRRHQRPFGRPGTGGLHAHGRGDGAVVWFGLSLRPNLWMLMLWMVAAALWAGARLFRLKATSLSARRSGSMPGDHADPAGPRHRGQRRRQGRLRGFRRARQPVRRGGALRLGDGVGARALACLAGQAHCSSSATERKESHHADEPADRAADHAAVPGVAGGRHVLERPVLPAATDPCPVTDCLRNSARSWS